MHELSITRSVVAIVAERAAGQRVTRVRIAAMIKSETVKWSKIVKDANITTE